MPFDSDWVRWSHWPNGQQPHRLFANKWANSFVSIENECNEIYISIHKSSSFNNQQIHLTIQISSLRSCPFWLVPFKPPGWYIKYQLYKFCTEWFLSIPLLVALNIENRQNKADSQRHRHREIGRELHACRRRRHRRCRITSLSWCTQFSTVCLSICRQQWCCRM